MDIPQILFIALILLGLYWIWSMYSVREEFTSADLLLAQNILTYLQSPNNFIGYANLLLSSQNTSTNLPELSTYDAFVSKGSALTVADILDKF